jgi:uncharacterized protein YuzE
MEKKRSSSPSIGVINFSIFRHEGEIEAIYIKLRNGKVSKSREVGPHGEAVIDLDKSGNVIGIEMLEPGKLTVRLFNRIRKEFKIRELADLKLDRLQEVFA